MDNHDRENVTKASQGIAMVISDLEQITRSSDPLLAELGLQALQDIQLASERIQRLASIVKE